MLHWARRKEDGTSTLTGFGRESRRRLAFVNPRTGDCVGQNRNISCKSRRIAIDPCRSGRRYRMNSISLKFRR
jgi:hypothetical protein